MDNTMKTTSNEEVKTDEIVQPILLPTTPQVAPEIAPEVILEEPRPVGRPSSYTQEVADELCFELSQGKSLRTVCKREDMPSGPTVFKWMRDFPDFLKQYARSKEEACDAMAEDIQDIADTAMDVIVGDRSDNARVSAVKMKVDARIWLASKLKAKKYGNQIDITTNGKELPTPIYGGNAPSTGE